MRPLFAAAAALAFALLLMRPSPARNLRQLPPGIVEVASEIAVGPGGELRGAPSGTILRAAPGFRGRALVVCSGAGIRLNGFAIDGNRGAVEVPSGLPPYDRAFADFTPSNGVLADRVSNLTVHGLRFREVAGFAILVARSSGVSITGVTVEASGGRNPHGRNNATGGILLEEGTTDFRVAGCTLRGIRGNGVWTHSLYTSARNSRGRIEGNFFQRIGRDAIQVGHATGIAVVGNAGYEIGFPFEEVDKEGGGIPVAIDTAGNVDRSSYAGNRFEELNGKCIDLDGFHDGEVRDNACVNRRPPEAYPSGNYGIVMNNTNPDMQSRNIRITGNEIVAPLFGGIFVIGTGHTVAGNRLADLNTARCNENAARFGCYYSPGEPDMLRSGIYLGRGAERLAPARGNRIEGNRISGFRMSQRCIASAPGIEPGWNTLRGNVCRD
jgi:hypothetical protein